MLKPTLPAYDIAEWRRQPFPVRLEWVCRSWALQGYGSPTGVYALYALKIVAFVAAWVGFCTFPADVAVADIGSWWSSDVAFQKAILWTMLFEGLGLGCGSGPLTGRYVPPFGGALYFLRPGTTKLPLIRALGPRRTLLDVALYAAVLALLGRALLASAIGPPHLVPILVLVPVLGVLDKTLFLVFRSEHYLSVVVCLLFAGSVAAGASTDWIAGSKAVWMAIWWWAATSKVNRHFPAVMCVMVSNSPFSPEWLKRRMYQSFPDDLRPSAFATTLTHFGTALEYTFPLVLLLSGGGTVTLVTLVVMTVFHLFILSQVPMGVPLEWNVVMIYGGWVLFGVHAGVGILSIGAPLLVAWLVAFHVLLPLYGSFYPDRVSFLLAMRYYAGNWACSVWLFREGAGTVLDQRLTKWSMGVQKQLGLLYDTDTIDALMSKVVAFRAMHLHGRAVAQLVGRAVDDIDRREWLDGEIVAGMVLGWNFGDGHLHGLQLLEAVQAQCGFASGDVRVLMIESEPTFSGRQAWTIADARDGVLERGHVVVAELAERQPWAAAG